MVLLELMLFVLDIEMVLLITVMVLLLVVVVWMLSLSLVLVRLLLVLPVLMSVLVLVMQLLLFLAWLVVLHLVSVSVDVVPPLHRLIQAVAPALGPRVHHAQRALEPPNFAGLPAPGAAVHAPQERGLRKTQEQRMRRKAHRIKKFRTTTRSTALGQQNRDTG